MIRPIGKHLDALYLSICGELPEGLIHILRTLKTEAQEDENNRTWVFDDEGIPGGPLWIQARGTKGYEFVIRNSRLYLQLSSQKHLPALSIQFLAEALYEYDLDGLQQIVDRLCTYFVPDYREQKVSRADIAVDFQSEGDEEFRLPEVHDVVTRARYRKIEYDRCQGQTFTLGRRGGAMQAQIYNKSAETAKTNKAWLTDVWAAAGYDPEKTVWRAEVRFYRPLLSQFGVNGIGDLRRVLGDMLAYAADASTTGSWVKFVEPESRDLKDTSARPAASWWVRISQKFRDGQLLTGRRRLRPKGLATMSKALDMYLAWASKVAALARAGGLHNASGTDFGKWLFVKGCNHLSRQKGQTWAEAVNQQTAKLLEEGIEPFAGAVFDMAAPLLDPEFRQRCQEGKASAEFSGALFGTPRPHLDHA